MIRMSQIVFHGNRKLYRQDIQNEKMRTVYKMRISSGRITTDRIVFCKNNGIAFPARTFVQKIVNIYNKIVQI